MANKGLIVKGEWLNEMFVNGKRWEMRSTNTKYRGEFCLIEQGTGLVVGKATLIDSFQVDKELAKRSINIHKVTDLSLLEKWCWAWSLTDVVKYDEPIPYTHPRGAVIWVNL